MAQPQTFTDNFDDNSIGAGWTTVFGSATEQGQRMRLPTTSGYSGVQTDAVYDFTDGAYILCQVPVVSSAGADNSAEGFIQAAWDANNLLAVIKTGNQMVARSVVAGTYSSHGSATYNATNHAWWRVRRSGSTIYFDTSADGITWSELGNRAWPSFAGQCFIGLESGFWGTAGTLSPAYYEFDNLNLAPAASAVTLSDSGVADDDPLATDQPYLVETGVGADTLSLNTKLLADSGGTVDAVGVTRDEIIVYQPPITISSGGTYTGAYQSTNPAVPAITIATTAAVILDGVKIRHAGRGVDDSVTGARLTMTGCIVERIDPGGSTDNQAGRAVLLQQPAQVVIEHCHFERGNGIWLGGPATLSGMRIRYNRAVNIGYWGVTNCCIQFFQSDTLLMPGGEIAWNHISNDYGSSDQEDTINNFGGSGGTAGNVLDIHHNLCDGAFGTDTNGTGYTGGGILAGDADGDYTTIRDNYVVSTTNYGVAITGGHDNTLTRNWVVNDARTQTGVLHGPDFGQGIVCWQGPGSAGGMFNNVVTDNTSGWLRRTAAGGTERANWWVPAANTFTGNVALADPIDSTDEQAARDAWDAARVAAGVVVGPYPTTPTAITLSQAGSALDTFSVQGNRLLGDVGVGVDTLVGSMQAKTLTDAGTGADILAVVGPPPLVIIGVAMFYVGRAGFLVGLPTINQDIKSKPDKHSVIHELLAGRAVDSFPIRRTWTLPANKLDADQRNLFDQLFWLPGPYRLLDPAQRNLLSANQSSGTDDLYDTTGFLATSGTLSSTTTQALSAPRSLAWAVAGGLAIGNGVWTGSSAVTAAAVDDTPVILGQPYTFSFWFRHSTGTLSMRPTINWFTSAGAPISSSTGDSVASSTSAWTRASLTAAAPVTAAYARWEAEIGAAPSTGMTVYLDNLQAELGATLHDWVLGKGVPVVAASDLDVTEVRLDQADYELTMTEVG